MTCARACGVGSSGTICRCGWRTTGLLLGVATDKMGNDRIEKVPLCNDYREGPADVSGIPGNFPPRSLTNF